MPGQVAGPAPESESDWDAARQGLGPYADPRIGRPSRAGTLLALLGMSAGYRIGGGSGGEVIARSATMPANPHIVYLSSDDAVHGQWTTEAAELRGMTTAGLFSAFATGENRLIHGRSRHPPGRSPQFARYAGPPTSEIL